MKPTQCTPIHQGLSNNTEIMEKAPWFERSQHNKQTKQTNRLPSFMDILFNNIPKNGSFVSHGS
jgi:hypothetical protein